MKLKFDPELWRLLAAWNAAFLNGERFAIAYSHEQIYVPVDAILGKNVIMAVPLDEDDE